MVSNRVHGCGLRSSTLSSLALVFTDITQTTLSLVVARSLIVVLVVYVDDILLTGSDSGGLLEKRSILSVIL